MPQTYDNYYKNYYQNNKDRINKNRKESAQRYSKWYYLKNRTEIAKRRLKAAKVKRDGISQAIDIATL